MDISNSYNSCCNNDFSKLFYKVFHNKYLLNNIIKQIHDNEWVDYKNIQDYNVNNRIRFKFINSLKDLVKKNLFSLLKCKLEAGEVISIDYGSLVSLFQYMNGNSNSHELLEILQLLFKNYSGVIFECFKNDMILNLIKHKSNLSNIVNILINKPFSVPVTLESLKSSFQESIHSDIYLTIILKYYQQNNIVLKDDPIIIDIYHKYKNNSEIAQLIIPHLTPNIYNSINNSIDDNKHNSDDISNNSVDNKKYSFNPLDINLNSEKEIDDFIKDNIKSLLEINRAFNEFRLFFKFKSLELANYTFNKIHKEHNLIWIQSIYSYIVYKSFYEANIQVLVDYDSLNFVFQRLYGKSFGLKFSDSINVEEINQLFCYLEKRPLFLYFSKFGFELYEFIKDIINHKQFQLSEIKINFNLLLKSKLNIFVYEHLLKNSDIDFLNYSRLFSLLLNNGSAIDTDIELLCKSFTDYIYNQNGEIVLDSSDDSFISWGIENYGLALEYWINLIKDNGCDIKYKELCNSMIDFYYKRILSCKETTMDMVIKYYYLLIDNSIEIKNTLYHTFHYIRIKSTKLVKYILSRPYILTVLNQSTEFGEDFIFSAEFGAVRKDITDEDIITIKNNKETFSIEIIQKLKEYDIRALLLPNHYKLKYIISASYDEILCKLYQDLTILPSKFMSLKYPDYLEFSLYQDVIYYLEVNNFNKFIHQIKQFGLILSTLPNFIFGTEVGICQHYGKLYCFEYDEVCLIDFIVKRISDIDQLNLVLDVLSDGDEVAKHTLAMEFSKYLVKSEKKELLDYLIKSFDIQLDCLLYLCNYKKTLKL